MTDTSESCLACHKPLPGEGGTHRRAKEAGWARSYGGYYGTGFICPDHRNPASDQREKVGGANGSPRA